MPRSFLAPCAFLCLVFALVSAQATSIFVEGVITKVTPGGFEVKGYDHYNATRYGDKITTIPVKFTANPTVVLDGRFVTRDAAIAVGRSVYAIGSSAGSALTIVLSEPAGRVIGEVVSLEGNTLTLKTTMGKDSMEQVVTLDADAAFTKDGGLVAKDVALAPGTLVRISAARKQSVLIYSEKATKDAVPAKGVPTAVAGVVKTPGALPVLSILKDGVAADFTPAAKKFPLVYDIVGDVCHAPRPVASAPAGAPACFVGFEKRPGVLNCYLVAQVPDAGLTDGALTAFDAAKQSGEIAVLGVAKAFTLDADAVITLDGKPAAAEALQAGKVAVSVFAARAQTIMVQPKSAH
jgi:hypothetical protein